MRENVELRRAHSLAASRSAQLPKSEIEIYPSEEADIDDQDDESNEKAKICA